MKSNRKTNGAVSSPLISVEHGFSDKSAIELYESGRKLLALRVAFHYDDKPALEHMLKDSLSGDNPDYAFALEVEEIHRKFTPKDLLRAYSTGKPIPYEVFARYMNLSPKQGLIIGSPAVAG